MKLLFHLFMLQGKSLGISSPLNSPGFSLFHDEPTPLKSPIFAAAILSSNYGNPQAV